MKVREDPEEKLSPEYSVDLHEKVSEQGFRVIRPQIVLPIGTQDEIESEADDKTVRKEYKISPPGAVHKAFKALENRKGIHQKIGLLVTQVIASQ